MATDSSNKVPNVPPLRFPEFTGEWKLSTIGDECDILCGYAFDGKDILEKSGDVLLMRGINIAEGYLRHSEDLDRFYSGPKEKLAKYVVRTGDVVIGMDGSKVGRNAATVTPKEDGAYLVQRVCRLRSNKTNMRLLIQYINNPKYYKYVDAVKTASAIPHISQTDIQKFSVYLPTSKQEQDKIGNLLSFIDERIATQNKIIDKLQSLMSGIVVSHFNSCNTKSTISIKDLGEAYSVGNLSKDDLSEEGKPCILYGELFTTYGCVACEVQNRTNKYAQATLSRAGDLLFPASTTVDAISLIAPTSLQTDGVYVAGDMFGIHISPQYKSEYISYLLNYVYNRKLSKYAQGSTIIHLHYADVKNATIQVPCLEEQNKCAGLLEALQTKLDIAKQLIDCYQTQKSYLLQRMFI